MHGSAADVECHPLDALCSCDIGHWALPLCSVLADGLPCPFNLFIKGRSAAGAVNSFRNKDRKLGCGCAGRDSWIHHESGNSARSRNTVRPFLKYPVRCSHWTVIRFLMYRAPFLKYRVGGSLEIGAERAVKRVLLDATSLISRSFELPDDTGGHS